MPVNRTLVPVCGTYEGQMKCHFIPEALSDPTDTFLTSPQKCKNALLFLVVVFFSPHVFVLFELLEARTADYMDMLNFSGMWDRSAEFILLHFASTAFFTDWRFVATLHQAILLVPVLQQPLLTSCLCVTFWEFLQYFKLFHYFVVICDPSMLLLQEDYISLKT